MPASTPLNGQSSGLTGTSFQVCLHPTTADFFDSEPFPTSSLEITHASCRADRRFVITADLSLKGISRPLIFECSFNRVGREIIHASCRLTVDRTKFGITFRSPSCFSDRGEALVADEFTLDVRLKASRVTSKAGCVIDQIVKPVPKQKSQ